MRKKEIIRERPFEYMRRRSNGQYYEAGIVKNWYIARAYVLDRFKDVAIGPDSPDSLHVVLDGDSPLMLALVRQLCLSAHFTNYVEYDFMDRLSCKHRTRISLVSGMPAAQISGELEKEEYLGLLPTCIKLSIYGRVSNPDSYLDVEIEVVGERPVMGPSSVRITEEEVLRFVQETPEEDIFTIDTRRAVLAGRVYELGAVIDNIPAEDIHSARRYIHALDIYRYKVAEEKIGPLVHPDNWEKNPTAVVNGVSSLCCSDCFASRAQGMRQYSLQHGIPEQEAWAMHNEALSLSEHNRWMVERLVMGIRQFDATERLTYETLFGRSRMTYWKRLKNNHKDPAHVDLCSYRDLRRIDPNNLKYDSFLLLAIPIILEKT